MRRNLSHIAAMAFNEPLLLEPAYARVFFCALGKEMGAGSLAVPQQAVQLDADGMQLAVREAEIDIYEAMLNRIEDFVFPDAEVLILKNFEHELKFRVFKGLE